MQAMADQLSEDEVIGAIAEEAAIKYEGLGKKKKTSENEKKGFDSADYFMQKDREKKAQEDQKSTRES